MWLRGGSGGSEAKSHIQELHKPSNEQQLEEAEAPHASAFGFWPAGGRRRGGRKKGERRSRAPESFHPGLDGAAFARACRVRAGISPRRPSKYVAKVGEGRVQYVCDAKVKRRTSGLIDRSAVGPLTEERNVTERPPARTRPTTPFFSPLRLLPPTPIDRFGMNRAIVSSADGPTPPRCRREAGWW